MVAGSAAAPAMGAQLEEIVVTATKREESVMDVPLAVQALSGDFLRDANLDDVKDLVHFTPGVTGNSKDSFLDAIRVRGIVTNDFGARDCANGNLTMLPFLALNGAEVRYFTTVSFVHAKPP